MNTCLRYIYLNFPFSLTHELRRRRCRCQSQNERFQAQGNAIKIPRHGNCCSPSSGRQQCGIREEDRSVSQTDGLLDSWRRFDLNNIRRDDVFLFLIHLRNRLDHAEVA